MGLWRKKQKSAETTAGLQAGMDSEAAGRSEGQSGAGSGTAGKSRRRKGGENSLRVNAPWVFWGILASLMLSIVFYGLYGIARDRAAQEMDENPLGSYETASWLFQSSYILYQNLYNVQNGTQLGSLELYLEPEEEYGWLLDEEKLNRIINGEDLLNEEADIEDEEEDGLQGEDIASIISSEISEFKGFFSSLEGNFSKLGSTFDYIIQDDATGKYLSNMTVDELNRSVQQEYFRLTFHFDEAGNVTVEDAVCGDEGSMARKNAYEAAQQNGLGDMAEEQMTVFLKYGSVRQPSGCMVSYRISLSDWQNMRNGISFQYYSNGGYRRVDINLGENNLYGYQNICQELMSRLLLAAVVLGLFLPLPGKTKPWNDTAVCSFPLEVIAGEVILFLGIGMDSAANLTAGAGGGSVQRSLADQFEISYEGADFLILLLVILVQALCFFFGWYVGVCARAVREKGFFGYIRERSLIYRVFPFVKGKALDSFRAIEHLNLTENVHRTIIKLVLVNAAVLFVICSLWFGGFAVTVIYSVLLYLFLRKYVSDLQNRYRILLRVTNEMAEGNLHVGLNEDLGVFEPFKPQLIRIQEGFRKAVDEEVKSQKMKAELITNVSHDLKTPLTAIITYVNLLKEPGITEEERREYLQVLENKSLRLKVLIEDLFEVSKANSQNITLNLTDVDIMNLVKQVAFELSDKMEAANLDVRINLTEEKVLLSLDSQKTYRIYENLFSNIAKYALRGTRVYVNGFRIDDTVVITLKNISAQEITVDSAELTERFVRGDASRNTEGSGLGLAIAKSFTELQGGELSLEVDGDLFKVTTMWKLPGADGAGNQINHEKHQ